MVRARGGWRAAAAACDHGQIRLCRRSGPTGAYSLHTLEIQQCHHTHTRASLPAQRCASHADGQQQPAARFARPLCPRRAARFAQGRHASAWPGRRNGVDNGPPPPAAHHAHARRSPSPSNLLLSRRFYGRQWQAQLLPPPCTWCTQAAAGPHIRHPLASAAGPTRGRCRRGAGCA